MPAPGSQPAQHVYCPRCRYILDGSPGPHCPECGREFDPNDPATLRTTLVPDGTSHLAWMLLGICLIVAPIPFTAWWNGLLRHNPDTWPGCALVAFFGYLIITGVMISSWRWLRGVKLTRASLRLHIVRFVSTPLSVFGCLWSGGYLLLIGAPMLH